MADTVADPFLAAQALIDQANATLKALPRVQVLERMFDSLSAQATALAGMSSVVAALDEKDVARVHYGAAWAQFNLYATTLQAEFAAEQAKVAAAGQPA